MQLLTKKAILKSLDIIDMICEFKDFIPKSEKGQLKDLNSVYKKIMRAKLKSELGSNFTIRTNLHEFSLNSSDEAIINKFQILDGLISTARETTSVYIEIFDNSICELLNSAAPLVELCLGIDYMTSSSSYNSYRAFSWERKNDKIFIYLSHRSCAYDRNHENSSNFHNYKLSKLTNNTISGIKNIMTLEIDPNMSILISFLSRYNNFYYLKNYLISSSFKNSSIKDFRINFDFINYIRSNNIQFSYNNAFDIINAYIHTKEEAAVEENSIIETTLPSHLILTEQSNISNNIETVTNAIPYTPMLNLTLVDERS